MVFVRCDRDCVVYRNGDERSTSTSGASFPAPGPLSLTSQIVVRISSSLVGVWIYCDTCNKYGNSGQAGWLAGCMPFRPFSCVVSW